MDMPYNLSKSFRIDDDFYLHNISNPHYFINIKIKEYQYNDIYYNITYKYKYIESPYMNKFQNSLYKTNFTNINENHEHIIIYKNKLTKQLIDFLFMEDNELKDYIGNTPIQKYRMNIINSLQLFEDYI